jgi:hypothetical protein
MLLTLKKSIKNTLKTFKIAIPILIGVLLLISLIQPYIDGIYKNIFTGNLLLDSAIGAVAGSLSFGIPVTSFIVAGELLKKGISLVAVTAFIVTWTTVGTVMFPLEASCLSKRFAITRNAINFFLAIILAVLVVLTVGVLK